MTLCSPDQADGAERGPAAGSPTHLVMVLNNLFLVLNNVPCKSGSPLWGPGRGRRSPRRRISSQLLQYAVSVRHSTAAPPAPVCHSRWAHSKGQRRVHLPPISPLLLLALTHRPRTTHPSLCNHDASPLRSPGALPRLPAHRRCRPREGHQLWGGHRLFRQGCRPPACAWLGAAGAACPSDATSPSRPALPSHLHPMPTTSNPAPGLPLAAPPAPPPRCGWVVVGS